MSVPAPLEDEDTEMVEWNTETQQFAVIDLPLPTEADIIGTELTLATEWPTLTSLNRKPNASKIKKR